MEPALIALIVVALLVIIVLAKSVTIVPQAQAKVIERLGRYSRTLSPGLSILVPFVDRVRATIDLREQVISFPPQPVITSDNLQVGIDTVVYFQVTDPRLAVYGIANYITGMEQLTTTTLRNVVGGLNLEGALTGRDGINSQLREVLDGTTGPVGSAGGPRGDQGDRPAALDPRLHGEADARRPRQARDHPDRRGRPAVGDHHRRGPEGLGDPLGRGQEAGRDPRGGGRAAEPDPARRG